MKVIFLKDVPKMGRRYEVKNVSDGYALNFLIPRKLAIVATPDAIKRVDTEKAQHEGEKKLQAELLEKNLKAIDGKSIIVHGKANEKGHLFAGLHKKEIVTELEKSVKVSIPTDFIVLSNPIKEIGEYNIQVLADGKKATFKLNILKA